MLVHLLKKRARINSHTPAFQKRIAQAKANGYEYYLGSIYAAFNSIPSIQLQSIIVKPNATVLQRIAEATRRRYFTIKEDWKITIDGFQENPKLNGVITIPREFNNKVIIFDGASIPLPWLSSFLTLGLMRPLGVLLTASIVHDFLFKHGCLLVAQSAEEQPVQVNVERHHADLLFRDIVGTVNKVACVGWVAWFFVRLGWFGVRYNGKPFTGRPPYLISAIVSLLMLICLTMPFIFKGSLDTIAVYFFPFLFLTYILFYLITIFTLRYSSARTE